MLVYSNSDDELATHDLLSTPEITYVLVKPPQSPGTDGDHYELMNEQPKPQLYASLVQGTRIPLENPSQSNTYQSLQKVLHPTSTNTQALEGDYDA